MNDFFPTGNSLENTDLYINDLLRQIYDIDRRQRDVFFGVNLIWPNFDLDLGHSAYFLSWHTEQMDVHWLKKQALRVYPRPVLVVSDTLVDDHKFWPDNIRFARYVTWHQQIQKLTDLYGICDQPTVPKYKISSLSFRVSQYKRFITSYLLENFKHDDLMLTYHGWLGKEDDNHDHPRGLSWLDALKEFNSPVFVNFNDNYSLDRNSPLENGDWQADCYQQALFNLTNESFHYTRTEIDGQPFLYPRPYITEKTWKPIVAGRPFISVGQAGVYHEFEKFGMRFDYGIDLSFDRDDGDLTRIKKIFDTLSQINVLSIDDLFQSTIDSVDHNLDIIKYGVFSDMCRSHNRPTIDIIKEFIC